MRKIILALAALLLIPLLTLAHPAKAEDRKEPPRQPNGLALTPPMGWNTWNKFACEINEEVIRKAADALVSSGMAAVGYKYVVIDDCWHGARDAHGDIQADPARFPSGIRALADYIHAKGLKFGIYSDAGRLTCAERPGSLGHEYQDAAQYAAWGVDYLKYDWCFTGTQDAKAAYTLMSDALRASGRDIVFSMCEWGTAKPWLWGRNVGNLWRSTWDIYDGWQGRQGNSLGVMDILDQMAELYPYAGPGHWNDPDMLEVGNGGMSDTEYRAHFSLWAVLAAPLIAGNDLTTMTPAIKAILTNTEVIAVDQDPLGAQGRRVAKQGDLEVWARPLASGDRAVVLLNRGTAPATITVNWPDLGYPAKLPAKVRDLWQAKDQGTSKGSYTAEVAGHGVVMVTIRPAV
ncbi:glycoside hydrolase family 27 protein [Nitrospirillum sp. BR 11752]|uniref:glycoside hydrolase family 27 protein n=1 Tax=Nitrospirillum sp. BR 11752 TaxID=3104293 RepID=UPI002ECB496D|nr:glycoside hydrolase family 27 protein [Nitrospirillum sp. BR 11752]